MMMTSDIRTIKVTDKWIYESPASQAISDSRSRRDSDLADLAKLLPQREVELAAELQKTSPDLTRVAILRHIIGNLRHTLNSVQR